MVPSYGTFDAAARLISLQSEGSGSGASRVCVPKLELGNEIFEVFEVFEVFDALNYLDCRSNLMFLSPFSPRVYVNPDVV